METIEMVQFKVARDVDENSFLKASDGMVADLKKQKGFIDRKLAKGSDGSWTDIVHWKTLADAQNAAEDVMKIQSCLKFFGMIDQSTIRMSHLEQAKSYE